MWALALQMQLGPHKDPSCICTYSLPCNWHLHFPRPAPVWRSSPLCGAAVIKPEVKPWDQEDKGLGTVFHVHAFARHYKQCIQNKQAMNDKLSEAAGLLRRASDMLLTVVSSSTMLHSATESVTRARNMMDRSPQGGTFWSLGSKERLRS